MRNVIFNIVLILFIGTTATGQSGHTAYIFMAEECPVCNYLGKTLKRLSTNYAQDVKFVAVFPQRMSNFKTASLFKSQYDLPLFFIEIDHDQAITNKYNATITPEVVLVNSEGEVVYQGRINNSYAAPGRMRHGKVTEDLELAIQAAIVNKPVPKPWPNPIGCYITKR